MKIILFCSTQLVLGVDAYLANMSKHFDENAMYSRYNKPILNKSLIDVYLVKRELHKQGACMIPISNIIASYSHFFPMTWDVGLYIFLIDDGDTVRCIHGIARYNDRAINFTKMGPKMGEWF